MWTKKIKIVGFGLIKPFGLYLFLLDYTKQITERKKMKKINEKLEINISGQTIQISHNGFKYLKNQDGGLNEVKTAIEEEIKLNKDNGFMPYNNFECAIKWKVI